MILGAGKVYLQIPGCNSLKEKRMVIRSIMDRVRAKFKISVGEVGKNDIHHLADIGFACVGNEEQHVRQIINKVFDFINLSGRALVIDEKAYIYYFEDSFK